MNEISKIRIVGYMRDDGHVYCTDCAALWPGGHGLWSDYHYLAGVRCDHCDEPIGPIDLVNHRSRRFSAALMALVGIALIWGGLISLLFAMGFFKV